MEGLDKTALGEYFGKNDKKVLQILHQYCSLLDFRKKPFD
jgi:Sec7-like guanine-nucleotide exchange factor